MLETILNSPLGTIVSVVVAICAIAFIWYYCLPALEELKTTRAALKAAEEEIKRLKDSKNDEFGDSLESIIAHNASVNKVLLELQSDLTKNPDRAFERIQEALSHLKEGDKDSNSALGDLRMVINSILESVQSTRLRDETLHNHINELLRYMYGINEKQNQIISALLGISKIHNNNRGIL